jgi:glycosyltransferase involved in cell wall biosynthesis
VPEPPTILQIIPELDTGGAEQSVIEVAEAIVKGGGRALVLSQGGRMIPQLTAAGAEWVDFAAASKNPATILLNARRIMATVRKRNVRLIQAESRAPAWSAFIAARQCGIPLVTTYHGAYGEKNALKKLYNSVMARSDIVIANSLFTANLVKARYGTPDNRLRVIYRGVDTRRFDRAQVSAERIAALRAAWGLVPNQKILLQPARLTSLKGHAHLIRAIARMRDRMRNAVLIVAGADQGRSAYKAELEALISELSLQKMVRLAGHVDDMPAAFAAAHVAFAVSTVPETFGLIVAEAQATGCPVIATDIGAPSELVIAPGDDVGNTRTGWLVSPGNLEAYEKAIASALDLTDNQRAEIAIRARANVRDKFTTVRMQIGTLDVYDEVLGTNLSNTFKANSR